jgi:hypothetical protein
MSIDKSDSGKVFIAHPCLRGAADTARVQLFGMTQTQAMALLEDGSGNRG